MSNERKRNGANAQNNKAIFLLIINVSLASVCAFSLFCLASSSSSF